MTLKLQFPHIPLQSAAVAAVHSLAVRCIYIWFATLTLSLTAIKITWAMLVHLQNRTCVWMCIGWPLRQRPSSQHMDKRLQKTECESCDGIGKKLIQSKCFSTVLFVMETCVWCGVCSRVQPKWGNERERNNVIYLYLPLIWNWSSNDKTFEW